MVFNNNLSYISTLDLSEFYLILKQIELGELEDEEIINSLKENYEYLKSTELGNNLSDNFDDHLEKIKSSFIRELKRRRRN